MAHKASGATGMLRPPEERKKLDYKVRAGRLGGLKTAEVMREANPEWTKERAQRGGEALLARYGRDYFRFLRSRQPNRPRAQAVTG